MTIVSDEILRGRLDRPNSNDTEQPPAAAEDEPNTEPGDEP
jgi:hypothetical protein